MRDIVKIYILIRVMCNYWEQSNKGVSRNFLRGERHVDRISR